MIDRIRKWFGGWKRRREIIRRLEADGMSCEGFFISHLKWITEEPTLCPACKRQTRCVLYFGRMGPYPEPLPSSVCLHCEKVCISRCDWTEIWDWEWIPFNEWTPSQLGDSPSYRLPPPRLDRPAKS